MSPIDHLVALLLVVALPLNQFLGRSQLRAMLDFTTAQRIAVYRQMIVIQWSVTIVLLAIWWAHGRSFAALGFAFDFGPRFWIALVLALAALAGSQLYYRRQLADPERMRCFRALVDRLAPFLPRSRDAMPTFDGLALTAGICEEVAYRGYAIWYALEWLDGTANGEALAVIVTSAAFGLGHLYQGGRGMSMVFSVGLLHGALYVLSGSLWIPMLLHAVIDLMGGRVSLKLHPPDGGNMPHDGVARIR